jgi:hypothetical protein
VVGDVEGVVFTAIVGVVVEVEVFGGSTFEVVVVAVAVLRQLSFFIAVRVVAITAPD